jgi:hypothetical protein
MDLLQKLDEGLVVKRFVIHMADDEFFYHESDLWPPNNHIDKVGETTRGPVTHSRGHVDGFEEGWLS